MALAKLDLRLEEELLEKVRAIARDTFGAKINHISGKPETTPTLIQLIQYGITYLESNPDVIGKTRLIPMTPDNIPDSILDSIVEKVSASNQDNYQDVLQRLSRLEEESNKDTYQDTYQEALKKTDELGENLDKRLSQLREKEISPILSKIENLEAVLEKFEVLENAIAKLENEIDDLKTPVGNDDPDPSPENGLQNKQLDALLNAQGIKCRPEYISRYTNDTGQVPPEVKETLDLNWIKKGKLWYPRKETP
jgi:polyhydroxyalkanoate synthesis regulator phasin